MTRKALVVGIKCYPNFRGRGQRHDLENPPKDAEAIARLLRDYGRFEVQLLPETSTDGAYQVAENGVVKAKTLRDAIYELFVQPKDGKIPQTALLFFAGHGFPVEEYGEKTGYLGASDSNLEQEEKSGVRFDWLAKQLAKSQVSEQIIWLDCCHSGHLTQQIFEQANPPNQEDVKRSIIAACRDSETAHGVDGHGVLTHLLQKALDPERYPVGFDINSTEVEAVVEREFHAHPKFKTYPQRPVFFHCGRPIHFWEGRGTQSDRRVESSLASSDAGDIDIETLVQQARDRLHDKIQNLHGTMQLLDVAHPVEIDRLYVDVNVLDEPTNYKRLEIDDLLKAQDYQRDFDRFGLSKVQKRVAGLQAVIDHPKLMVLGKPGAGKTTFLQHVVIECNNGNLLPDKIPILIRLRDFVRTAKKTGDFSLERHVASYLRGCERSQVTALLEAGKFLLLLDGLDEVPGANSDVVVDEIREVIESYPQNHLILTCRIQAKKYRFERFAYVEVADFKSEQIETFSRKYFVATAGQQEGYAKAQQFLQKLNLPENKQICELAVTPILLSLTCKVFGDTGKFYSKRHELYKEGLELLLSKWDESRGIKRDNVYRELSVKRKQELLRYIAAKKFEQEQYVLFTQEEIQGYIAEYLEISLEDSHAVLESIESQHGLLVARAQRIYSFSHLTFQEYFTASWWVDKNNNWQTSIGAIIKPHLREVFLLAVNLLASANDMLLAIKQEISKIINDEEEIQSFLKWIYEKALSVNAPYNIVAIRAFYFDIFASLEYHSNIRYYPLSARTDLFSSFIKYQSEISLPHLNSNDLKIDFCFYSILINIFDCNPDNVYPLEECVWYISDIFQFNPSNKLKEDLNKMSSFPPVVDYNSVESLEDAGQWLCTDSGTWIRQLKNLMIEHRNIGQDWPFNEKQKNSLKQYYDANKLLVDCLNSGCVVSDEVRQEIEETLLLPITEIERRKQEKQIGNNPSSSSDSLFPENALSETELNQGHRLGQKYRIVMERLDL